MNSHYGFTLDQMLEIIGRDVKRISVEAVDSDQLKPSCWRLYVFSHEHGEFDQTGGLFDIVKNAFKPHLTAALKARSGNISHQDYQH